MKKTWILLGVALVLFVLWVFRERFDEYTATKEGGRVISIKKPPLTGEEVTRAKGLYTRESNWTWAALTDAEARQALEGFWPIWESEQNRITLNQITDYANSLGPSEKKPEYIQLLRAYYIEQGQDVFSMAYQTLIGGGSTSGTGGTGTGTGTGAGTDTGAGVGTGTGAVADTGAGVSTGSGSGFSSSNPVPPPDMNNPSSPYSDADIDDLYNQIPQNIRSAALQALQGPLSEQNLKYGLRQGATKVYNQLYKNAQSPLSANQVEQFVNNDLSTSPGLTLPEPVKQFVIEGMKILYVGKSIPTTSSGSSGTGATGGTGTTGASILARSRPGVGDANLRQQVAAYLLIPQSDPMINRVILEVRRFYDEVYVPGGKVMPTTDQIRTFVSGSSISEERKPGLTSVIDYWFTEPASPGDSRLESRPSGTSGGRGGGSYAPAYGDNNMAQASQYDNRVWGPPFVGLGAGRGDGDGAGSDVYPNLLGPPPTKPRFSGTTGRDYSGTLPPSGSLGADFLARFLPFSRQPGDMDVIPDPYRVSQSYSASSYSSKNEPVPFLTDFSAFLK